MSIFRYRNIFVIGSKLRIPLPTPYVHHNEPYIGNKHTNVRCVATHAKNLDLIEGGFFQRMLNKFKYSFYRQKLKAGGYQLYETVADQIDYATFMKELNLPDTFHSWFLITELHVWMLMVRVMADAENGRTIRNLLVEALWKDVNARYPKLGVEHVAVAKSQVKILNEEFHAAIVSYDEGLGDDKALAGAVWRRLFSRSSDLDVDKLAAIVNYIRQTIVKLDSLGMERVVLKRDVTWLPPSQIFDNNIKCL